MLHHPNYSNLFLVFPDASDKQLGRHVTQIENNNINFKDVKDVLEQEYYPILFHARKLNNYQMNYPVIEKELLSIVNLLLECRNTLHSTKTYVHSDHKNLTNLNTLYASTRV